MKVDETFESVNRIWQEISVIVVIHAVALVLAIYANLIPMRTVLEGIKSLASLPDLAAFRASLQRIGLDLPFVVGAGIVVYVVLFQRLSSAAVQIPVFRLLYSQPALWRAGKCFDELRQLVHWFEGYTASTELTDLEVTLGLAIAQYAKEYPEHHRQLVDARLAAAAVWARYYAGFCLLAFASFAFLVTVHPTRRGLLLPVGLLVAAIAARCGWEAQIERAVLGRLRFAIDCAIISGSKREEAPAKPLEPRWEGEFWKRIKESEIDERVEHDIKHLEVELELAVALVRLPPPCLPYQRCWVLHYVRAIGLFKNAGGLPLVRNKLFRKWFVHTLGVASDRIASSDLARYYERRYQETSGAYRYAVAPTVPDEIGSDETSSDETGVGGDDVGAEVEYVPSPWIRIHLPSNLNPGAHRERYNKLWQRLVSPEQVPDDRVVVLLLRSHALSVVVGWLVPRMMLVDEPKRYWARARKEIHTGFLANEPFRKWVARVRER